MEGETLSFAVRVPKSTLSDLALNVEGLESIGGLSGPQLADLLRGVIQAGIEEYLGETDEIDVRLM